MAKTTTKKSTDLPDGVEYVTIKVPIVSGEMPGFKGGPMFLGGQLKMNHGRTLQRLRVAERRRLEEANVADSTLQNYDRSGQIMTIRSILELIERALESKASHSS